MQVQSNEEVEKVDELVEEISPQSESLEGEQTLKSHLEQKKRSKRKNLCKYIFFQIILVSLLILIFSYILLVNTESYYSFLPVVLIPAVAVSSPAVAGAIGAGVGIAIGGTALYLRTKGERKKKNKRKTRKNKKQKKKRRINNYIY